MLATIRNDYHNTFARVKYGKLSPRTVKRVRAALCGIDNCTCGGDLSERPHAHDSYVILYIGENALEVAPN